MKAAERKNNIKLVIKGNGLKFKSEEKLKEILQPQLLPYMEMHLKHKEAGENIALIYFRN